MAWPPPASSSPGLPRRAHRRAQVHPRLRAAGALADARRVQPDHQGGAAEALAQAAGDHAHHAGVPVGPGHHQHGGVGVAGELGLGLAGGGVQRLGLHRLALAVERVELGGQGAGLVRIVGGQQAQPQVGAPDPARPR